MDTPTHIEPLPIVTPIQSKIPAFLKNKNTLMIIGAIIIILSGYLYYLYKNNKLTLFKKKNTIENDKKLDSDVVNSDVVNNDSPNNILNINNDYYIYDNGTKIKIDLKELISSYNLLILQEQQKQNNHMPQYQPMQPSQFNQQLPQQSHQQPQQQTQQAHQQQALQQQALQQQALQQQAQQAQQSQQHLIQQMQQQQMQQQQMQQQQMQQQPKQQCKINKQKTKIIHPTDIVEEDSDESSSENDIEELKHQLVELEKKNKTILNNDN
jgi:hypothetical protein